MNTDKWTLNNVIWTLWLSSTVFQILKVLLYFCSCSFDFMLNVVDSWAADQCKKSKAWSGFLLRGGHREREGARAPIHERRTNANEKGRFKSFIPLKGEGSNPKISFPSLNPLEPGLRHWMKNKCCHFFTRNIIN